jgi:hypothetical protein
MTERPSPEAMDAIADLLVAGEQYGIGITLTPDGEGWEVGYMQGMGGGDLAEAYDLETAAKAALRPLMRMGVDLEERRAERHRRTADVRDED